MAMALQHPKLQGLRRWSLGTHDAHGLYRQFGFSALAFPERHMELTVPDIYKRSSSAGSGACADTPRAYSPARRETPG